MKICLPAVIVAASTCAVSAGDATFSYHNGSAETREWGTRTAEWYDVAVYVPGTYAGKTITGIRMPFTTTSSDIQNIDLWLSEELSLARNGELKKVADPDIETISAAINAEGYAEVVFSEPYTITEAGVYAGTTFKVLDVNNDQSCRTPIYLTNEAYVKGTWLHSTITYTDWEEKSETLGQSTMQVFISGIDDNAVSPADRGEVFVMYNEAVTLSFDLKNTGANSINKVDITYETGSLNGTKHYDFAEAIGNILGSTATVELEIPAFGTPGNKDLKITVDKVNGELNNAAENTSVTRIGVMSFVPERRPVFEEYTGLWCGYCPRGFIGLERMNELYPDDFIGISYHDGDDMTIMKSSKYPSEVTGFPSAWMDREFPLDPYGGTLGDKPFGIDKDWLKRKEIPVKIKVENQAYLSDDKNYVECKTSLISAIDHENPDYHIEFILTADDLYNSSWGQTNYYSGDPNPDGKADWAVFTDGGETVRGLHFNDVIIATSRLSESEGDAIVKDALIQDIPSEFTYRFDLSAISPVLVQNKELLNFIAILLDADGKVVNADKIRVGKDSGVTLIESENNAEVIGYYDLTGRRVAKPGNGIYIVRTSDGKAYKAAF